MVIFTKKFGTLDPHLPLWAIVWDKVPNKTVFWGPSPTKYSLPLRNIQTINRCSWVNFREWRFAAQIEFETHPVKCCHWQFPQHTANIVQNKNANTFIRVIDAIDHETDFIMDRKKWKSGRSGHQVVTKWSTGGHLGEVTTWSLIVSYF